MNTKNSKIAAQSRQWIINALLTLMQNNCYDDITITQLAQEADLSRKTIYRLFCSKDAVLDSYLEQLSKEFTEIVHTNSPAHYPEVAYLYFQFWSIHKEFLTNLVQNNLLYRIHQVTEVIAPAIFHIVKSNTPLSNDLELLSYAMSFSLGGLNNILIKWCNSGMDKHPEDLVKIISLTLQTSML